MIKIGGFDKIRETKVVFKLKWNSLYTSSLKNRVMNPIFPKLHILNLKCIQ